MDKNNFYSVRQANQGSATATYGTTYTAAFKNTGMHTIIIQQTGMELL